MIEYRHPKTNKPILSEAICTDDFGTLWVKCRYTDKTISSLEGIYIGAIVPQVNGTYFCDKNAMSAFKEEKRLFDESEANCNTCKHLERIPHKKQSPSTIMTGICIHTPYRIEVKFHPDDWMGMKCWEARL